MEKKALEIQQISPYFLNFVFYANAGKLPKCNSFQHAFIVKIINCTQNEKFLVKKHFLEKIFLKVFRDPAYIAIDTC